MSTTPFEPALPAAAETHEDDWDDAPITPRARLPRLTKLLVLLLIAAAAFAGGIFAQRHWGKTSAAGNSPAGGTLSGRNGSRAPQFGPAGASAGNFTVGQVAYVRGRTLYVADSGGNIVKVQVPRGVAVTKTVSTRLKGVRPGDTVVVRGSRSKTGGVKASSVSVGGSAGGGGLFGGNAGAGATARSNSGTTGGGGPVVDQTGP